LATKIKAEMRAYIKLITHCYECPECDDEGFTQCSADYYVKDCLNKNEPIPSDCPLRRITLTVGSENNENSD
jgi:translation initiation factor 2 beta subunit (eIF-2beta)/eIF-5